jgi:dihydroflavonol-4-reductase
MTLTLVTGVTGTIGSALVRALLAQGRAVRCLVRDIRKGESLNLEGVEFASGDFTNKQSVEAAFKGVTHVFHAGGMPEQWTPDTSIFERVNAGGTQNMVDAAMAANVKSFVYVSTQDMFDLTANPFDETMPGLEPLHSAYERSKRKAEDIVEAAVAQDLPAIFIHPVAVYGPGAVEISGLNRFLADLLKNDIPILLNGGMPVVLNTDLARGILAAEAKAAFGEHYIFSDSYQTLSDIALAMQGLEFETKLPKIMPDFMAGIIAGTGEMVSKITKGKPLISKGELGVLKRKGRPSAEKAKTQLGWEPTSFNAGLSQTIPWLKERNA